MAIAITTAFLGIALILSQIAVLRALGLLRKRKKR
jgi:hypothetical protein